MLNFICKYQYEDTTACYFRPQKAQSNESPEARCTPSSQILGSKYNGISVKATRDPGRNGCFQD